MKPSLRPSIIRTAYASALLLFSMLLSPIHAGTLGKWKEVKSGTASDIEGVAFGNGTFVAVGVKGLILTSQDGVRWTKRSAGITRDFNDVTFASGRFIAVCKAPDQGSGAKIWVSDSNGASWKYRDTDVGGDTIDVGLHSVNSDGSGNLVAVGGFGALTRSHDNGETWSSLSSRFTFSSMYGIAYGNGKWVATSLSGVFFSTDTNTWTQAAQSFGAYKVAFGNNRFVATTSDFGAGMKSSIDGSQWSLCKKASGFTADAWPGYSNGVAYADGLFVMCGGNGDIWTSETGLLFKRWTSPLAQTQLQCVAFGQRMFIAGGFDGRMVASPPWFRARVGNSWDHPYTMFDTEDGPPRRIGLPEYRVNTASLNVVLESTLFYMRTLGVPINIRIAYNSTPTADGDETIGLFGKNWRFRYESLIGRFGPEAEVLTGGGRLMKFSTADGSDISSASAPVTLVAPSGIFDTLKYTPGVGFDLFEKSSKLTYRFSTSGGPDDALWRLTRVTDRSGNSVVLDVNGTTGRIASITDPAGRTVSFTYDVVRNLCTGITVPDGRQVAFRYDQQKNLTGITDMAGYEGAYEYDENGYLQNMDTEGRINKFSYIPRPGYEDGGPDGKKAADQILSKVTNAAGGVTTYELLEKDAGVKRIDPRGESIVFKSTEGQTAQVADPLGKVRSIEFNAAKLPASFTNELGQTTSYSYDERGNVTSATDALGHQTSFTYDARDNMKTRTNPLSQTWSYSYTGSDRLDHATSPLGFQTSFVYFGNGRLQTLTDARSKSSHFIYDAYGNLQTVSDALGNQTQLAYGPQGLRCTSITDPRGKVKLMTYDANDRPQIITHDSVAGTPVRTNVYDAFGQTLFTDEQGRTTTITRNDFGYVTALTDPLGNTRTTEYDPSNNPVVSTDELGRAFTTTYDDANRPLVITDPRGKKVTRTYDSGGSLTSLTDKRNGKTVFKYDGNRRLTETTDALGKTVKKTHDALGRVTTTTNARGQQIVYTFDADGRMEKKEYKATTGSLAVTEASFVYDSVGNVTQRTDQWGVANFTFDDANRVSTATYPTIGGSRKAVTFTYTATGLIKSITYPDGLTVDYTHDNFNRLSPPSTLANPGGASLVGSGERANRITSITATVGTDIRTIGYTYNSAAQITSVDWPGALGSTYDYDGAGRLRELDHTTGGPSIYHQEFTYDVTGNPLREAVSGVAAYPPALPTAATAKYDICNQVSSWGGKGYSYDADGNLTAIAGNVFSATYTAENRPVEITRNNGATTSTVRYTYDAAGLRVKREVVGGGTTHFFYGPGGLLLFTTNGTGVIGQRFIWNGNSLAAILTGPSLVNDLRHVLLDRAGNVIALADPAGSVTVKYGYQPYGGTSRDISADSNPFTFVGGFGVMDEGDGLFYMKNRFYDSVTGRFLQRDPLGMDGGINLYAYANGNPIASIDPEGKNPALLLLIPVGLALWNWSSAVDNAAQAGQEAGRAAEAGERTIQYGQQTVNDARRLRQTGDWNGGADAMVQQMYDRHETANQLFNSDIPNTVNAARDTAYHGTRAVYRGVKAYNDAMGGLTVPTPSDGYEAAGQVLEKVGEEIRDNAVENAVGLGEDNNEN